jgi:hypothetical protein
MRDTERTSWFTMASYEFGFYATVLIAVTVLLPLSRILYNVSPFHPLSAYPGPRLWHASRLPWAISLQKGRLHADLVRMHEKYGTIVRIAPNELSYIDARAWKDIYLTNARTNDGSTGKMLEKNPVWFQPLVPGDPPNVMNHNEDDHARHRRAFMPAFTDKALQSQMPIITENVSGLIEQLRRRSRDGVLVNIVDWLNFVTFDISGQLSFGETFGSVAAGKAHPWVDISIGFGKGECLWSTGHRGRPLHAFLYLCLRLNS